MSAFFNFVANFFRKCFYYFEKYMDINFFDVASKRLSNFINYFFLTIYIVFSSYFIYSLIKVISFLIYIYNYIFDSLNQELSTTSDGSFPIYQVFLSTMILESLKKVLDIFLPYFIIILYCHIIMFILKKLREFKEYVNNPYLIFNNTSPQYTGDLKGFARFLKDSFFGKKI